MERRLGVYIHIPFCASKCSYCDFYSLAGSDKLMPRYQNALISHITEYAPRMSAYYIDTIYFGGGTPSFYGAHRLCEIFNALKNEAQVLKDSEVTVEMNPDSVTKQALRQLRKEGVNRISLGVQSANDDILRLIGRRHNWKQAVRAIELARAEGFDNISLDLIYGLPSQTKNDWADTLVKALDLRPEHISCYGLKLEEETPMYGVYGGSPFLPTDDDQADMYLYAVETMERYAYSQYEISNFSVPGKASRHNMKYWTGEPYIGFGPGAHSYVDGVRYSFVRDLSGYISGVQGGKQVVDEYEKLDGMGRGSEYIMLGMRTTRGISAEEYNEIYRSSFAPIKDQLREFEYKGWAVFENGRWHFTSQGFLLSNQLINMLLEAQAEQKLIMNPWVRDFSGVFGEKTELPPGDEVFYRNRQQHTET